MPELTVQVIAGWVAGFLNLAAFVPYIVTMYRPDKPTRPNRVSWWIWFSVSLVIAPSYTISGAHNTAWVADALVAGTLVVALLLIRRGQGGWTRFDRACLLGAIVSGICWYVTGSALTGLFMAILADAFGVAGTMRQAYLDPHSESKVAWSLFFAGDLINLLAVQDWSLASFPIWFYAIYMVGHTGPILATLYYRTKTK